MVCVFVCVQKFQVIEEAHLRQMKQLIKAYSHSIEDTHVQVGQVCWSRDMLDTGHFHGTFSNITSFSITSAVLQVHEEFKQNVENIGIDNLIQKFAEQKGTGKDRPGKVQPGRRNVWLVSSQSEINAELQPLT